MPQQPAPTISYPSNGQFIQVPINQWFPHTFTRTSVGGTWDNHTIFYFSPYSINDWQWPTFHVRLTTASPPNIGGLTGTWYPPEYPGPGHYYLTCRGSTDGNPLYLDDNPNYTERSAEIAFDYVTTPPIVPSASFSNSPKEFFESKTVQFNDSSSGNPTSWSWKYRVSDSGDAWVEFSTAQNPTRVFSV